MTAGELVAKLEALNIELVVVAGDRLRYRPKDAVNGELLEQLKQNKVELLQMVGAGRVEKALPGGLDLQRTSLCAAEVAALPLEEFAHKRLVIEVYSQVLRQRVLLASDNAVLDPGERRVVYRAAELRQLLGVPTAELSRIHESKKIFGGTLVAN